MWTSKLETKWCRIAKLAIHEHEKFSFHGPYTVTEKLNEVSYKIKDELDGEERIVSVQQIVPFFGEHEIEEISEEDTLEWRSLQQGRFVVFRAVNSGKLLHVAEICGYSSLTKTYKPHHYVDFGTSWDLRNWQRNKKLSLRRVYPEYEDSEGASYTDPKRKGLKPESPMMEVEYTMGDLEITIIAKNFCLESGGKIPANVCHKVDTWLKDHKWARGTTFHWEYFYGNVEGNILFLSLRAMVGKTDTLKK